MVVKKFYTNFWKKKKPQRKKEKTLTIELPTFSKLLRNERYIADKKGALVCLNFILR